MSKKRTRYSAQFKLQLAMEAAKGLKTINELATDHAMDCIERLAKRQAMEHLRSDPGTKQPIERFVGKKLGRERQRSIDNPQAIESPRLTASSGVSSAGASRRRRASLILTRPQSWIIQATSPR